MIPPPPISTLFPYTTLFRSLQFLRREDHVLPLRELVALHHLVLLDFVAVLGAHILLLQACTDRKSTRLNSSHGYISYAVFCLKKKKNNITNKTINQYTLHTD